jgi:nondiscriminating aspartyl-tRNA synthetase
MKNRKYIEQLKDSIGEEITIAGWMHRFRNLGKVAFILLRDKSGMVQCVLDGENIEKVKELQVESVLKITGKVVATPKGDAVELQVSNIEILSPVKDMIPVEINKEELDAHIDTIIDHRPVTLRHPKQTAIFRVQAEIVSSYKEYMKALGFTEVFFPILAGASSEGGSEFFEVNYYDRKATLAQSAQLYKQITMGVFEGVYGLSYSFRAEKYATTRHLTEFNQFEFEMGFIESMEDVMVHCEASIRYIIESVEKNCKKELDVLGVTLPKVGEKPFPRITLKEALEVYKAETGVDDTAEPDLSPAAEKWISKEWAPKVHGTNFIFVTHYPEGKRPFYTMLSPEDSSLTESFDLIGNGCEITTGGQRIHNYEEQVKRIKEKGLNPDDFEGYLEMHKYGIPPEGGFGMGLQRVTQNLLGLGNIKEATIFPRDVQRLTP